MGLLSFEAPQSLTSWLGVGTGALDRKLLAGNYLNGIMVLRSTREPERTRSFHTDRGAGKELAETLLISSLTYQARELDLVRF